MSNTFFEKKLQLSATTRNWNSVLKIKISGLHSIKTFVEFKKKLLKVFKHPFL